jgi:NTE family protein
MSLINQLEKELSGAENYAQWKAIAERLDALEGKLEWRQSNATIHYDAELLAEHIRQLRTLRQAGSGLPLMHVLQESVYRHLGEISNPALYQVARTGTQLIVREFLQEAAACLRYLCDHEVAGLSKNAKHLMFEQASHNFGQTALMLSGGAAFGIYHTGVAKALWSQNLLPKVISGSSMGSIVAAAICTRSDAELEEFFAHPERIHREAIKWHSPSRMLTEKYLLDSDQLMTHIMDNVGPFTFREAYAHSGRTLNITVSPTRSRQKPRVLCHLTAPNVLIAHSALASCAIPGAFPPVRLQARSPDGVLIPYLATEKWIDGSVHGDLPKVRIARMHNVNHTIVSQANPHVLPFITHRRKKGVLPFVKHLGSSMLHSQLVEALEVGRDLLADSKWRPLLDKWHAMARQTYLGDINIQLPFQPSLYRKVVSNPSMAELNTYIRLGEQATWPKIAEVEDQTFLYKVFEECLAKLRAADAG